MAGKVCLRQPQPQLAHSGGLQPPLAVPRAKHSLHGGHAHVPLRPCGHAALLSPAASTAISTRCHRFQHLLPHAAKKGFGTSTSTKQGSGSGAKVPSTCPCGSGKPYQSCCGRYISGTAAAPTAEALLRSRFSAYKLGEADYLVDTTHIANPEHTGDRQSYKRAVKRTARSTQFLKLIIVEEQQQQQQQQQDEQQQQPGAVAGDNSSSSSSAGGADEEEAFITFRVRYLLRDQKGASEEEMEETSKFVREKGRWLYRDIMREK